MIRTSHLILLAWLAIFFLQAGSCQQRQRAYRPPTAAELLDYLDHRAKSPSTMRAEARMWHRSPQGKIGVTVRMMFARPDKLRFDVFSSVDSLLASLVAAGGKFAALDTKEDRHYFGQATPCNVARFLRVALSPADIVAILAGSTPLIDYQQTSVSWDGARGAEILTLSGRDLRQTIILDGYGRSWDLLGVEVRDLRGETLLKIEAEGYRLVGGVRLPRKLHLEQPRPGQEIDLTFRDREVDLSLPAQAFELPEADGLPSQELTCP